MDRAATVKTYCMYSAQRPVGLWWFASRRPVYSDDATEGRAWYGELNEGCMEVRVLELGKYYC